MLKQKLNWKQPLFYVLLPICFVLAIVGANYRAGMLAASASFIPQATEVAHNGLFYVFGLLSHRHQDAQFPTTGRQWLNGKRQRLQVS